MKLTMTTLLALILVLPLAAQNDSLVIMFWNVENFFDWTDSGTGDSDREFSAEGSRHWTKGRFYAKCSGVAKEILRVADSYGRLPDAIGLAEVENSFVVKQILRSTALRKIDYKFAHFESPDHRGIDCALIYRESTLGRCRALAKHIYDSTGALMTTRDILVAEFDSLSVLVNHHPSKVGGKSDRREAAMARMTQVRDSLGGRTLCIGDFNDDVWGVPSEGTIKYNGAWEKIDGCFARGFSEVSEKVFSDPVLMTPDKGFGGLKPLRTYSGPRYLGGISDHLPVVVTVFF